jgi:CheY-like chemotaxis protein
MGLNFWKIFSTTTIQAVSYRQMAQALAMTGTVIAGIRSSRVRQHATVSALASLGWLAPTYSMTRTCHAQNSTVVLIPLACVLRFFMPTTTSPIYAGDHLIEGAGRLSGLAISPSVEDLLFLERKFKEAHWKLSIAGTYREALAELGEQPLPVVLSDCQLPDGSWKDVLSRLARMRDRPRLIVFSRDADEGLWSEVLNLGGFDLLTTPFREEELVFAVGSAWMDWEGDQGRRLRESAHT